MWLNNELNAIATNCSQFKCIYLCVSINNLNIFKYLNFTILKDN